MNECCRRSSGARNGPSLGPSSLPRLFSRPPDTYVARPLPVLLVAILAIVLLAFICGPAAVADSPRRLPDSNGDGHPLFGNPEYLMCNNPLGLAMGDLDGDGDTDTVVANSYHYPDESQPGDMAVLLNQGDGLFEPRWTIRRGPCHLPPHGGPRPAS